MPPRKPMTDADRQKLIDAGARLYYDRLGEQGRADLYARARAQSRRRRRVVATMIVVTAVAVGLLAARLLAS